MVQDTELAIGVVVDGKLHTFDTQHDVLQRLGVEAYLRVGDVGVDDDQVIGVDRVKMVLNQKLAVAAYNIKKFHVIMGMGNGVPVAAVFGAGGV